MSSNTSVNFQLPANLSSPIPIGSTVTVTQYGLGQVTISAYLGTASIVSNGSTSNSPKLRAQFSSATCVKIGLDSWHVIGDII
jgi:hypothetical protein